MSEIPQESEVQAIIAKLEGAELSHIRPNELRSAVIRAIQQLGITSATETNTLVELIDTNEEQLAVHEAPSDPTED